MLHSLNQSISHDLLQTYIFLKFSQNLHEKQ